MCLCVFSRANDSAVLPSLPPPYMLLRTGTAYFVRSKTNGGGEGRRPGGYRVSYTVGPAKIPDTTQDSNGASSGNGNGNGNGGGKEGEAPTAPT